MRWLSRWLTSYCFTVKRGDLPEFNITLYAVNDSHAVRQAARIGQALDILLVGPT